MWCSPTLNMNPTIFMEANRMWGSHIYIYIYWANILNAPILFPLFMAIRVTSRCAGGYLRAPQGVATGSKKTVKLGVDMGVNRVLMGFSAV